MLARLIARIRRRTAASRSRRIARSTRKQEAAGPSNLAVEPLEGRQLLAASLGGMPDHDPGLDQFEPRPVNIFSPQAPNALGRPEQGGERSDRPDRLGGDDLGRHSFDRHWSRGPRDRAETRSQAAATPPISSSSVLLVSEQTSTVYLVTPISPNLMLITTLAAASDTGSGRGAGAGAAALGSPAAYTDVVADSLSAPRSLAAEGETRASSSPRAPLAAATTASGRPSGAALTADQTSSNAASGAGSAASTASAGSTASSALAGVVRTTTQVAALLGEVGEGAELRNSSIVELVRELFIDESRDASETLLFADAGGIAAAHQRMGDAARIDPWHFFNGEFAAPSNGWIEISPLLSFEDGETSQEEEAARHLARIGDASSSEVDRGEAEPADPATQPLPAWVQEYLAQWNAPNQASAGQANSGLIWLKHGWAEVGDGEFVNVDGQRVGYQLFQLAGGESPSSDVSAEASSVDETPEPDAAPELVDGPDIKAERDATDSPASSAAAAAAAAAAAISGARKRRSDDRQ